MTDLYSEDPQATEIYLKTVDAVRKTVKRPLTDEEAHEATRNMIEFFRISLAIYRRMNQDSKHDRQD